MRLLAQLSKIVLLRRIYRTRWGRFIAELPREIAYALFNRNPYVPPPHMIYTGRGDFIRIGEKYLDYFKEFGGITPASLVLDVGCGIGRMAMPFIGYLDESGEYYGFDIVKEGPQWCKKKISSRHANFHFKHVDIRNNLYNKSGSVNAENFRFPYEGGSFDFVLLTSVFTHMSPAGIRQYLAEINRVLKPGARALFTANILNDESRELIEAGRSRMKFIFLDDSPHAAIDVENPCDDIALDEAWLRAEIAAQNLSIIEPVHYGQWCGRERYLDFQDLVVIEKPVNA